MRDAAPARGPFLIVPALARLLSLAPERLAVLHEMPAQPQRIAATRLLYADSLLPNTP